MMKIIWLGLSMWFALLSPGTGGGWFYLPHFTLQASSGATSQVNGQQMADSAQAPVAVAHVSRNFYLPRPNSPVYVARLSAGFSSDADGEIVEFIWQVDGSSYRGAEIDIVSFQPPAAQTRVQVQLTVRDNDGQVSTLHTELVIANISVVSDQSPP